MIKVNVSHLFDPVNNYKYRINYFNGGSVVYLYVDLPPEVKEWLITKNIFYEFDESFSVGEDDSIEDISMNYDLLFSSKEEALEFKLTWC